eukprot:12404232-Karenia_brevis.AAC.1
MEEGTEEEMVLDPIPSPMREDGDSEVLGPPWPGMSGENLILPGKGNPDVGKGSGPSGPQYGTNTYM